jgi:hypothetical protein
MTLRVLVDENTSPRIVDRLEASGHDAIHVIEALGPGADDADIRSYAAQHGYAVLTHDDDFLATQETDVAVLYYADDSIETAALARRLLQLGSAIESNQDLAAVTSLGRW